MFDPEKVERFEADTTPTDGTSRNRQCVLASDYDQLLRLYRESEQANKLLLSTVNDLTTWRANIGAFTEPVKQ